MTPCRAHIGGAGDQGPSGILFPYQLGGGGIGRAQGEDVIGKNAVILPGQDGPESAAAVRVLETAIPFRPQADGSRDRPIETTTRRHADQLVHSVECQGAAHRSQPVIGWTHGSGQGTITPAGRRGIAVQRPVGSQRCPAITDPGAVIERWLLPRRAEVGTGKFKAPSAIQRNHRPHRYPGLGKIPRPRRATDGDAGRPLFRSIADGILVTLGQSGP